jgi:Uma2 family endonuclease
MLTGKSNKIPRTAVEVFEMLPEGILCQVIENVIYMSPAPFYEHQRLLMIIAAKIHEFVTAGSLGECTPAPVDVYLDVNNAFQPDIVFILKENLSIVKGGKVKGSPDLVIEILSHGSKEFDLGKKKLAYEKNGVKEYFAVDHKTKEVQAFYLKKNKYETQPKVQAKLTSKLLKKTFKF